MASQKAEKSEAIRGIDTVPSAPGRWPGLGHAVQLVRRPLPFLQRVRAMGPIVRIHLGPQPAYVVNDPDLIRRVLVNDAHHFDKGLFWEKLRPLIGNGLASSDGEFHLRQRRLMQPAFNRSRIAHYADIMSAHLLERVQSWQPGQVLSVPDEARDLALSLVGHTLFSSHLGGEAVEALRKFFPIVQDGILTRTLLPLRFLEKLPTPGNRRLDHAFERISSTIDATIGAYRADGVDRGDLLSMLIYARAPDTGEAMTDSQIRDEVVTLALAGSDTTSNALSWALYQLGQHPEIAARIAAEVQEVAGDRPPTFQDVIKLEYTNRVLSEVFRLYTFPALMRRTVTDVVLGDVHLPPGTHVVLSVLAMHRDSAIYQDPLRFDPERWLPERTTEVARTAHLPFGAGRRQCIGDRFAWTEVMMALATIVPRWELHPLPGQTVKEVVRIAVNPSALSMRLVPRARAEHHPAERDGSAASRCPFAHAGMPLA
jgi:cytochrome P450